MHDGWRHMGVAVAAIARLQRCFVGACHLRHFVVPGVWFQRLDCLRHQNWPKADQAFYFGPFRVHSEQTSTANRFGVFTMHTSAVLFSGTKAVVKLARRPKRRVTVCRELKHAKWDLDHRRQRHQSVFLRHAERCQRCFACACLQRHLVVPRVGFGGLFWSVTTKAGDRSFASCRYKGTWNSEPLQAVLHACNTSKHRCTCRYRVKGFEASRAQIAGAAT